MANQNKLHAWQLKTIILYLFKAFDFWTNRLNRNVFNFTSHARNELWKPPNQRSKVRVRLVQGRLSKKVLYEIFLTIYSSIWLIFIQPSQWFNKSLDWRSIFFLDVCRQTPSKDLMICIDRKFKNNNMRKNAPFEHKFETPRAFFSLILMLLFSTHNWCSPYCRTFLLLV